MPEGSKPVNTSENRAPVETVGPDQVFAETDIQQPVTPATWTQRAGMRLAAGVGGLATIVTLAILARWIWMSWCISSPTITSSLKPEDVDTLVKNYRALQDQAFQSASQMFEAVVVKALLPVFTSILGYIFGARTTSDGTAH